MLAPLLPMLLAASLPADCPIPESMPAPAEEMAGAGEPDWCLDGVDLSAQVGPSAEPPLQLLIEDGESGLVQLVQWRTGPLPAREHWTLVHSSTGSAGDGAFREMLIQFAGERLIVVTSNPAWRIGNAVCTGEGGPMAAYLAAGETPTERDARAAKQVAQGALDPAKILCMLLTPHGEGYAARFFGPGGRPLSEIDEFYAEVRIRIVAPGGIEAYRPASAAGDAPM